jgi:GAF domain-containing protein
MLAEGFDVIDLLEELVGLSVRLLDVKSAGLLLADDHRVLHVMAATSAATHELEVVQLQRDEGPCLECFDSSAPVAVPDLDEAESRWPRFVPAARTVGFLSVHAVPMRLRDKTLGTLGLFGVRRGSLNDYDLQLAQAFADVASVSLVQQELAVDAARLSQQLQSALDSRVLIEQAKGIVAEAHNLQMSEAFVALRQYARSHGERLTDVAASLVQRRMAPSSLALKTHSQATPKP